MKKLIAIALFLISGTAHAALALSDLAPSRTRGVAPLGVVLKLTATDGTYPFHELNYRCLSGDSAASVTTYGAQPGKSLNYAEGPVVAFLYETPGTYTLTCGVSNASTTITKTTTITVDDWTTASPGPGYSAAQTACVYNSAVGTGCPSGATELSTSSYATAVGYLTTGTSCGGAICKRVLLKRGDTFTLSAPVSHNMTGPTMIGAYGTGAKPIISQTGGTTSTSAVIEFTGTASDIRIADVAIDGNDNGFWSAAFGGSGAAITNLTMLNIDVTDMSGLEFTLWQMADIVNGLYLAGSTFSSMHASASSTTHGILIYGQNVAIINNSFDGTNDSGTQEHHMRLALLQNSVVASNTLIDSPATKELIALRAPCSAASPCPSGENFAAKGITGATATTDFVVITDNRFEVNTYAGIHVGPVDSGDSALFQNVIIDKNFYPKTTGSGSAVRFLGDEITIRNNIIHGGGGTTGASIVQVDSATSGVAAPENVWIYNNTLFTDDADNTTFINILTGSTTVDLRNNLFYASVGGGTYYLFTGVVSNAAGNTNNTTATATGITTSPSFVNGSGTMSVPLDFALASASAAATGGTAAFPATKSDFFHCWDKAGANRIGAVVPRASAICRGAP